MEDGCLGLSWYCPVSPQIEYCPPWLENPHNNHEPPFQAPREARKKQRVGWGGGMLELKPDS